MSKFLEKYRSSYKPVSYISNIDMAKPLWSKNVAGDIGLELEMEGSNLPTTGYLEKLTGKRSKAAWGIHQDGSLRGESAEYVLNTPCFADEVDDLVVGLYKVIEARGSRLDLSNRCSTHVHVNVGGLKINELTSYVALWSTFEEALINWCGEERTSNHFCLSTKDSNQVIDTWNGVLSGNGLQFAEGMKYSALNIRTLRTIGSFEFRCMRASESPYPIIDWAKAMVGIRNYAVQNFQNPQDIAGRLSEFGGTNILGTILQDAGCTSTFLNEILSVDKNADFETMSLKGLRRAQPIILGHPWHMYLPEIQKVEIVDPFNAKAKPYKYPTTVPEWEPVTGEAPFNGGREAPPGRGDPFGAGRATGGRFNWREIQNIADAVPTRAFPTILDDDARPRARGGNAEDAPFLQPAATAAQAPILPAIQEMSVTVANQILRGSPTEFRRNIHETRTRYRTRVDGLFLAGDITATERSALVRLVL